MRGDSNDERAFKAITLVGTVWFLILVSGILAANGWVIGWCIGFVCSLGLLGVSLYKSWI